MSKSIQDELPLWHFRYYLLEISPQQFLQIQLFNIRVVFHRMQGVVLISNNNQNSFSTCISIPLSLIQSILLTKQTLVTNHLFSTIFSIFIVIFVTHIITYTEVSILGKGIITIMALKKSNVLAKMAKQVKAELASPKDHIKIRIH